MKILRLTVALLLLGSASMLLAQTPTPAKEQAPLSSTEPFIVDAHPSPYRPTIYYRTNVGDQRFDMRDATIFDIIALAYNRERDDNSILDGPTWIDFDHFDIIAKIPSLKAQRPNLNPANVANPSANPCDQIRPVLQRVLAERFHLTYHTADRPLPGYVMTVAKGGAKLAEAKDPDATSDCHAEQDKSTPGLYILTCTSETMAQFLFSYFAP